MPYYVNLVSHLIISKSNRMAKESMKAREVKRAKMVAKYAAKRERLKAEGDTRKKKDIPIIEK